MALNRYVVRVDPQGKPMDIDILDTSGVSVPAFESSQFAAAQLSLPLAISAPTDFWLRSPGPYDVSCKVGTTEIATLASTPARVQVSDVPVLVVPPWEVLAPSSSGGSSAGGDFATWHRATTVDATSGAFDYAADLTGSSGTSIAVDDSTDWITNFGWPVPKVTVSGVYTVVCRVSKAGSNAQVQVGLYNASGVQTGPFMPAAGGNQLADIEADASGQAVVMFTTYLAAGTHISVDTVQPSDPDALNLAIQRCA